MYTTHYAGNTGLAQLLSSLTSTEAKPKTYPPYNIVKDDENKYRIEIALAGFTRKDIEIKLEKRVLTVSSTNEKKAERDYIYRGIASRAFTSGFTLAETIVVEKAEMVDGILVIHLENRVPKDQLPKIIKIE